MLKKEEKRTGFMINIDIPGYGNLELENIVLDYNGTIAKDGKFKEELEGLISDLSKVFKIYVITADTFGTVEKNLKNIEVNIKKLVGNSERYEKQAFIKELGSNKTVAIGNGNNDILMLSEAQIGICIMGEEGCAKAAIENSDIVIGNIKLALELFKNPKRLIATLRY